MQSFFSQRGRFPEELAARSAERGASEPYTTISQMVAYRLSGKIRSALEIAERLCADLEERDYAMSLQREGTLPDVLFQVGLTAMTANRFECALTCLRNARELAPSANAPQIHRDATAKLALILAYAGSTDEAGVFLAQSRALPPCNAFFEPLIVVTEQIADALIRVDALAPDAEEMLHKLDLSQMHPDLWPFALAAKTRWKLAQGMPLDVLEHVRVGASTHPVESGSLAHDVTESQRLNALIALGELPASPDLASSETEQAPFSELARARANLYNGQTTAVAKYCRRLLRSPDTLQVIRTVAVLLLAWIEFTSTETLTASSALSVARIATAGNAVRLISFVPYELLQAAYARVPGTALETAVSLPRFFAAELPKIPSLTPAEIRVAQAILAGRTVAQAASELHLSPHTVRSQLHSIYRKASISTRAEFLSEAAHWPQLGPTDASSQRKP